MAINATAAVNVTLSASKRIASHLGAARIMKHVSMCVS